LNLLFAAVAVVTLAAAGRQVLPWLPWQALVASSAALALCAWAGTALYTLPAWPVAMQLAAAVLAAALVMGLSFAASADLRAALRR
jgi:hypothetical protein